MLLALLFGLLIAPLPAHQGESQVQLEILLNRAAENARRYTDVLRNLTADETRETEVYDNNGRLHKRRRTRAAFIVHQAGEDTLAEYRRVFEVDGKPVKADGDRREPLPLVNGNVTAQELEAIHRESSKYDLETMYMRGMSLNQAWPLEREDIRRDMTFRMEGTESIGGRAAIIVRYEYKTSFPWRQLKVLDLPESSTISSRGRIWIDSETAEIWRYETETIVTEPKLPEPAVLDRMEFFYSPSAFGIPTPQRIVWTSNTRVSRARNNDKTLKLSLSGRVVAEYGPFSRFGTDVKITPVKQQ